MNTTRRRAFGIGASLRGMLALAICFVAAYVSLAQTSPSTIIAQHIRQKGFLCEEPSQAEVDEQASRPNEIVWALSCKNAKYYVTLIPDMAAQIEVAK